MKHYVDIRYRLAGDDAVWETYEIDSLPLPEDFIEALRSVNPENITVDSGHDFFEPCKICDEIRKTLWMIEDELDEDEVDED